MAIKAPIFNGRDIMDDIATLTGGQLLSPELGYHKLERVDPVYVMGKCDKVKISKNSTVFIRGSGSKDKVDEKVKLLES